MVNTLRFFLFIDALIESVFIGDRQRRGSRWLPLPLPLKLYLTFIPFYLLIEYKDPRQVPYSIKLT